MVIGQTHTGSTNCPLQPAARSPICCRLVNNLAELAGYGGQATALLARQQLAVDVRKRIFSYWNIDRFESPVSDGL